ncbi:MAG TPA: hypothetical protein VEX68_14610 [Bryobacteraceae bacterium]|nr:hypothetical protein [Bryobacteraceae bacterium]
MPGTDGSDGLSFSHPRDVIHLPVRLGVPYFDYDVTADGQRLPSWLRPQEAFQNR